MSSASEAANEPLHVAIIGAGITGVTLALGLQARKVSFTVYERAPGFHEIGAGIGFSPNAERAMGSLNPDMLTAYRRVANPNGEDYFQWIDGYHTDELIFKLHVGKDGFQGCRRSDILEEWAKLIPRAAVEFNKEIDTVSEPGSAPCERLRLHFKDGTTALADAVIGCDGIRSRVRQLILSPTCGFPAAASHPSYTRKFCFRALAPMPLAISAIGTYKSETRFMYNGPGAHVITYPVANTTLLNILAVISDPNPSWPHQTAHGRHTAPGTKAEAEQAFKDWHPTVRNIISLLPDQMDKWGIFDMAEHPAPGYTSRKAGGMGRVCVAGDAAHATGPHLGAGGGMGIEDALALASLLDEVNKRATNNKKTQDGGSSGEEKGKGKGMLVEAALAVYNEVRYDRTQDVVQSTRAACDLFQWRDPEVGRDPERFGRDITARFHKIWHYDVDGMADEALARLDARTS